MRNAEIEVRNEEGTVSYGGSGIRREGETQRN